MRCYTLINSITMFTACFKKKKKDENLIRIKVWSIPRWEGAPFFVSYDKQFYYKAYIKKIKHYFFLTMEGATP